MRKLQTEKAPAGSLLVRVPWNGLWSGQRGCLSACRREHFLLGPVPVSGWEAWWCENWTHLSEGNLENGALLYHSKSAVSVSHGRSQGHS